MLGQPLFFVPLQSSHHESLVLVVFFLFFFSILFIDSLLGNCVALGHFFVQIFFFKHPCKTIGLLLEREDLSCVFLQAPRPFPKRHGLLRAAIVELGVAKRRMPIDFKGMLVKAVTKDGVIDIEFDDDKVVKSA
ncbi:proteasome subunit beta type-4 like protein [Verticillium longisporum]|nr:proteasome subunit beta type-4 like protein [Verticillium longisporum]